MADTVRNPRDDPLKYIFGRTELERIPRWEQDGISKYREDHLNEEQLKPSNLESVHPLQQKITELLGEWPSGFPFHQVAGESSSFLLCLPYQIQKQAAEEQQNLAAAKSHLLQAYKAKDPKVRDLVDQVGLKSALHKATRDSTRFPPFAAVIAPLLHKKLATDTNLELLFGDVGHVRGVLLKLGPDIKDPPPENSPAAAMLSPLLTTPKVAASERICGECGARELPPPAPLFSRCAGCKSIQYCSKECQRKSWPIHRPDCFKIQGKPVSADVLAKAESAKAAREEAIKSQEEETRQQGLAEVNAAWQTFLDEDSSRVREYLYDCDGKKLRAHLPDHGIEFVDHVAQIPPLEIGFKFEERLSLGMYPDGIDDRYNFRGSLYSDPSNGHAKIMLLYRYLYPTAVEACDCSGYHIDGLFVVDQVVKKRAKWKRVKEPQLKPRTHTRLDFLVHYLKAAKDQAKPVDQDVDLGIHNPGDPSFDMINTANGIFNSLSKDKIW